MIYRYGKAILGFNWKEVRKSCEKYTSQKGRTVGMAGSGNHSTCNSAVKAARPIYCKTWNFLD